MQLQGTMQHDTGAFTGNGTALPNARAIPDEEASPGLIGQQVVMALAGIHYGLQLQPTQQLVPDQVIQVQLIADVWRLHCCQ